KYNRANYFIQIYANLKEKYTIYLSSNHWHRNRLEKGNSFSKGFLGCGVCWEYLEAISTEGENWRIMGERSLWSVSQETEVSGVCHRRQTSLEFCGGWTEEGDK
ncbi:mCG145028, partial [Mus musculus]